MSCPTCGRERHAPWCGETRSRADVRLGLHRHPWRGKISPLAVLFSAAAVVAVALVTEVLL